MPSCARPTAFLSAILLTVLWPAAGQAQLVPIAPELRLAPGAAEVLVVELPAELLERRLALSLLARLEHEGLGGSTHVMQIAANGTPITASRLLNKPLETEMLSGLLLDWFGRGAFRVAYSPDYEAANRDDHPACLVGGHAYDFVLDLTGLVQAGRNEIVIRHNETLIDNPLVLRDVAIVDAPEPVVVPDPAALDPDAPLPVCSPRAVGPVSYQLETLPGGGLRVSVGDQAFTVESSFSFPHAGWNRLAEEAEGDEGWEPARRQNEAGQALVTAQCRHYRLQRAISSQADHVAISDRLTNLTGDDLHISVKHAIGTAGLTDGEVYLRGLRSRIMQGNDRGADNPTVLVCASGQGLGMVAEDDVLRVQCAQVATADPAEAALVDHYFMLPPGGSYELRWSLYPIADGDYFDFVNAIRRNWGTNFTIPGPFAFVPHPTRTEGEAPYLAEWLSNVRPAVVSLQIPMPRPGELAHGLAFLRELEEQQRLKAQADLLRQLRPGVQVLQYLHTYITRLDEAVEEYADAHHLNAAGEQETYAAGAWKPTFWLFLPTTTNSYGRAMNATFDLGLDDLGFDGVYWDELAYSKELVAHGIHDGYSALPDMATLTVAERVALTPLYCQEYQVQQARRVLDGGKLLIGNGQPMTETMTRLHFPRFVEAWHPSNLRKAHLYCPLGLSSPDRVESGAAIVPSIRSHLENGGLWYYYCNWGKVNLSHPTAAERMFPFTPIELHAGYLIGEERIITARSGLFGWNDQSGHRVFIYGPEGGLLEDFAAPLQTIDGSHFSELRLPPGAMAIIERVR